MPILINLYVEDANGIIVSHLFDACGAVVVALDLLDACQATELVVVSTFIHCFKHLLLLLGLVSLPTAANVLVRSGVLFNA